MSQNLQVDRAVYFCVMCKSSVVERYDITTKSGIDPSINCGKGSSIAGLNDPSYTAPNLWGGVLSRAPVQSEIFPCFVICFKWEKENVDFGRRQVKWTCELLSWRMIQVPWTWKLNVNNNYEFETQYSICAKFLVFLKVTQNNTSTTYTPYFSPETRSDKL
jgi:hypothetical protein